jgi:MFS family permease
MPYSELGLARLALWTIFFVNGAILSSWAPRIPEVKDSLGLTDAELGIALLGIAGGSVPALILTAKLLQRLRDTPICVVSAIVFSAALPLIPLTGDLARLTAVLFVLGAASGALDVAMNTAGISLQAVSERPVLSGLHGGYSLGVLTGVGGGTIATYMGVTVFAHFMVMAAVLVLMTLLSAPVLLRFAPRTHHPSVEMEKSERRGRRLPVLVAVLAVSCLLVEGLVTDWSALLITRDLGAGPAQGALALTAFSLAMFVSRSCGDEMLLRFSEKRVVMASALLLPVAVLIGILVHTPLAMSVSVAVIGLLVGPLSPVAISCAGRSDPSRAASMAAKVSVVGYIAHLAGPPFIGLAAEAVSLPVTFTLVIVLATLGIGVAARERRACSPERTGR